MHSPTAEMILEIDQRESDLLSELRVYSELLTNLQFQLSELKDFIRIYAKHKQTSCNDYECNCGLDYVLKQYGLELI